MKKKRIFSRSTNCTEKAEEEEEEEEEKNEQINKKKNLMPTLLVLIMKNFDYCFRQIYH